MGQPGGTSEKSRLCPSCRMEISVLAVKCRFCGESVGRPRDESRNLTIDDLGGETIRHYAPSSSVMEAMEAFRSEHDFKSNPPEDAGPERKSLFGMSNKKKAGAGKGGDAAGLPQLDERSQALASLAMPTVKPTTFKKPKGPSVSARVKQLGGIVAGIIVLLVVANFAYKFVTRPTVELDRAKRNPAEDIMARGGDPAQAVIEAARALRLEKHSKNAEVLTRAHEAFTKTTHELLNAPVWTPQKLRDAAKSVDAVFKEDSSAEIRKLKEEVDEETFAYQMSLLAVEADEATFGLSQSGSGGARVVVQEGDIVAGRFKVVSIKRDRVQVVDSQRKDRPLTYYENNEVTSP